MEKSNISVESIYKATIIPVDIVPLVYELIKTARVPAKVKIKASGLKAGIYYFKLRERRFKVKELRSIMLSIIYYSNNEIVKDKNPGHITQSLCPVRTN